MVLSSAESVGSGQRAQHPNARYRNERRSDRGRISGMYLESFFERATQAFEVLGVSAMVVGSLFAFLLAGVAWQRFGIGFKAFKTLRDSLGSSILLGLDLFVAADIVKTVTSTPSLTDAAILGLIVLIRTVLSISIEIEVGGVAPWRRALTTGPAVLTRTTRGSLARSPDAGDALPT